MSDEYVLDAEGVPEGKKCSDCQEFKPFEEFQRTPKGARARDCKACRRGKYEAGLDRKKTAAVAVTKDWIIAEAQKLYTDPHTKLNDKIKLLDTIARNVSDESRSVMDDAKVIQALIASKKKVKEIRG